MAVNRIDFGGETLIDISVNNEVAPRTLLKGKKGFGANGENIEGLVPPVTPDDVTIEVTSDDKIKVKDLGIDTAQLKDEAVTEAKIKPATDNGKVLTTKDGAVSWEEASSLPDGGTAGQFLVKKSATDGDAEWKDIQVDDVTIEVASDKLQVKDDGISTDKIADEAVTVDKIADEAVETDKIKDENVTLAKLNEDVVDPDGFILLGDTGLKIDDTACTENQILTKNASGDLGWYINPIWLTNEARASISISKDKGRNTSTGTMSFAEGGYTEATGNYSHAEGNHCKATADQTHAEGCYTQATSKYSHSEGYYTIASGEASHAEGYSTEAAGANQHVSGKYNIKDTANKYSEIIGNGSSSASSNARTLDWDGTEWCSNDVQIPVTAKGAQGTSEYSLRALIGILIEKGFIRESDILV